MDSQKPPQPRTLDYASPPERGKQGVRWWIVLPVALVVVGFVVYEATGPHGGASNRTACLANLRQIGIATLLYAQDHGCQFPDGLGDLWPYLGSTDVFVCPSSSDSKATGATTQAIPAEIAKPGHCSYIYLGNGLTKTCPATTVLAYEPLANHGGDGMNVLYGDGSVQWAPAVEAKRILAELAAGHNPPRPAAPVPGK